MRCVNLTLIAAALSIIVSAVFVLAAPNAVSTKALSNAAAHIACNTNFLTGIINSTVTNIPSLSSLSQYSTTLQSDLSQLQTYANNGDVNSYRNYVKTTYDPDVKQAREAINSVRRNANLTSSQMAALKSDYQSLFSVFETCNFNALKAYAQEKTSSYIQILAYYQNVSYRLGTKGMDTSNLTQIVNNANSQIVQPLQAAVNSANDSQSLRIALNGYCIFDGCRNGTNFHLAAKFEVQRLTLILNKLQTVPKAPADKITNARNYLNTANSLLSSLDNSNYAPGQSDQLWSTIKLAGQAIKDVFVSLRSR